MGKLEVLSYCDKASQLVHYKGIFQSIFFFCAEQDIYSDNTEMGKNQKTTHTTYHTFPRNKSLMPPVSPNKLCFHTHTEQVKFYHKFTIEFMTGCVCGRKIKQYQISLLSSFENNNWRNTISLSLCRKKEAVDALRKCPQKYNPV